MITLCGLPLSNYYNKVKLALLEKEVTFREETVPPGQTSEVLKRSPAGKIPFIMTDEGYLSESQAILEYLDDAYPQHSLYPANRFEKAKCREFIQHLELNVELVARRLYKQALFGGTISEETKTEVRERLTIGLTALSRLTTFSPYVIAGQFTAADITAWLHLTLVSMATQNIYGEDLVSTYIPQANDYKQQMLNRPHVAKVAADWNAAIAEFLAKK